MEAGRVWFLALWRNPLGTLVLYGALLTHLVLALSALYERRTLRVPFWELTRLIFGLTIPLMLAPHVIGTRVAHTWYGTADTYERMLYIYWQARPDVGIKQTIMLIVAWTHAMLGLHYWLRLRPWYPRAAPAIFTTMLLIPILALLGFADGGQSAVHRLADPATRAQKQQEWKPPDPEERATLDQMTELAFWGVGG